MGRIGCRASNRVFVGLPLCRNGDYLKTIVEFAFSVAKSSTILSLVPGVFKPIVGNLLPWSKRVVRHAAVHAQPLIQERLAKLQGADNDQFDKSVCSALHSCHVYQAFGFVHLCVIYSMTISHGLSRRHRRVNRTPILCLRPSWSKTSPLSTRRAAASHIRSLTSLPTPNICSRFVKRSKVS